MARPIPDDRLEEERRRMRFHQVRTQTWRWIWSWRVTLLGLAFVAAVYVSMMVMRSLLR